VIKERKKKKNIYERYYIYIHCNCQNSDFFTNINHAYTDHSRNDDTQHHGFTKHFDPIHVKHGYQLLLLLEIYHAIIIIVYSSFLYSYFKSTNYKNTKSAVLYTSTNLNSRQVR
jgi:hypothetical protein